MDPRNPRRPRPTRGWWQPLWMGPLASAVPLLPLLQVKLRFLLLLLFRPSSSTRPPSMPAAPTPAPAATAAASGPAFVSLLLFLRGSRPDGCGVSVRVAGCHSESSLIELKAARFEIEHHHPCRYILIMLSVPFHSLTTQTVDPSDPNHRTTIAWPDRGIDQSANRCSRTAFGSASGAGLLRRQPKPQP